MDGEAESGEEDEIAEDLGGEVLADVAFLEMSDFVGENGEDFLVGVGFEEGVEQGDAFIFPEAREKGVGFAGAFGAVDDENSLEGEGGAGAELGNFFAQGSVGHGRELVEKGQEPGGGEEGEDELEGGDAEPGEPPGLGEFREELENHEEEWDEERERKEEIFREILEE